MRGQCKVQQYFGRDVGECDEATCAYLLVLKKVRVSLPSKTNRNVTFSDNYVLEG